MMPAGPSLADPSSVVRGIPGGCNHVVKCFQSGRGAWRCDGSIRVM
jgi:hypothetical protein